MILYDFIGNSVFASSAANVLTFGAKGDGVTDDSKAIQAAIDSRKNGGVVIFPAQIYLITTPVQFYSNQFLFFEPGATLLQGANMTALLLSWGNKSATVYSGVHDSVIYGATFDGSTFETNITLAAICHSKNITFKNCIFRNAYGNYHNLEINSSYNTLVERCDFEGSRKTAGTGELIQIDKAGSNMAYPWPCAYDNTLCKFITIKNCIFHDSPIADAIGNHTNAAHSGIKIVENVFDGLIGTSAVIKLDGAINVDVIGNTFSECNTLFSGTNSTYNVSGNTFIDVTNAPSGSIYHNNMINGVWTA